MLSIKRIFAPVLIVLAAHSGAALAAEVAFGGNAYVTQTTGAIKESFDAVSGLSGWSKASSVISTYVHVAQPGVLDLKLKGNAPPGGISYVRVTALGKSFDVRLTATPGASYELGSVNVAQAGYVRIDLQGISKTTPEFGQIIAFDLSGPAATGLVYANDPANYYWSRRGASVHLSFPTPANTEYVYSELNVPVGQDPVGSYFMANGNGEGYFGIQVNSTKERRVLFSIWDADSGAATTLVRKGPKVTAGGFGGEGTGGQSYLVYPWKAGNIYKFITRVHPNGSGSSSYSSWFYAPEDARWYFIAEWLRPDTNKWLTDFYSFVENFEPENGYLSRIGLFGQQWTVSNQGVWSEVTKTYFDTDATGNAKQRLDFSGGLDGAGFFLRNGGFGYGVAPNQYFVRAAKGLKPDVDLNSLP
ncbi:MAG: DUF3472 domain-containing protein [Pseudomonadota bacterium]